jgi:chain length determinant protein tyrosine kinase EpsG
MHASPLDAGPPTPARRLPPAHGSEGPAADDTVIDLTIGHYLAQARQLSHAQIEEVLAHQRRFGLRFGESAVALGLVNDEDVLWALSQQFHYPYAGDAVRELDPELVAATDPFGDEAEVFRDIRSQLMAEQAQDARTPQALAVLSPDVGDGKSYFAANLAIAFSQLGASTVLVDADLRTPRQHRLFRLPAGPGLSGLLSGRSEADLLRPVAGLPALRVLPVGTVPPNPLELVQRPVFRLLMRELCAKFDHVVVDTPAASHGADARVIAAQCGAAVVLGRRRATRMQSLQALLQALGKSGAQVAGVMVNEY